MTYESLANHADYEIETEYPFTIKRKSTGKVVTVWNNNGGYPSVNLNQYPYQLHRIIALQFVDNDDIAHKTCVDHINHDRSDYHLTNLRWITSSNNNRNRSSSTNGNITYQFVDEIPAEDEDDIVVVNDYGNHQFEFVYFYNNVFYYYNGIQYRILHIGEDKRSGSLHVNAMSTLGKQIRISFNKFKKMYGLI